MKWGCFQLISKLFNHNRCVCLLALVGLWGKCCIYSSVVCFHDVRTSSIFIGCNYKYKSIYDAQYKFSTYARLGREDERRACLSWIHRVVLVSGVVALWLHAPASWEHSVTLYTAHGSASQIQRVMSSVCVGVCVFAYCCCFSRIVKAMFMIASYALGGCSTWEKSCNGSFR